MIIVLHGVDTFRSRIKLKKISAAYHAKHKDNVLFSTFDSVDERFVDIKSALESTSLFHDTRMIIVENVSLQKSLKEQFEQYKKLDGIGSDGNTLLIFWEHKSVASDPFFKKLLKIASMTEEFKVLLPAQKVNWFATFFAAESESVPRPIIQDVIKLCPQSKSGDDMWQIYNEIKKLLAFKKGAAISKQDLVTLNIGNQDAQIFPIIDFIFLGNAQAALYNMQLWWQMGEHPHLLFAMIERQLKILVLVKGEQENGSTSPSQMAKSLSLHPFVVTKTLRLTNRFSWPRLRDLYRRVVSLDQKNKSGQISPHLACEMLAAAILS